MCRNVRRVVAARSTGGEGRQGLNLKAHGLLFPQIAKYDKLAVCEKNT